MTRHIMIDIETMGKGHRSAIAAIGAVEFDLLGEVPGRSFYARVDLVSSAEAGMVIDAETVLWWLGQSEDARRELTGDGRLPLKQAMREFANFIDGDAPSGEVNGPIVWANGTSFDFPILSTAFRLCGMTQPWKYFNERDWRTVRKVGPTVEFVRTGTHHNALEDARHQALHLQLVMARMPQIDAAGAA